MSRDYVEEGPTLDLLRLVGRDVKVYSVSVRGDEPIESPYTGWFYELVVVDGGVD